MEVMVDMSCQSDLVFRIIDSYGGISSMARALGHAYPSTVQGWKARGAIPRWRINEIRSSSLFLVNGELRDMVDELLFLMGRKEAPCCSGAAFSFAKRETKNVIKNGQRDDKSSWGGGDAELTVPRGVVLTPLLEIDDDLDDLSSESGI